jgi:hypothetical protein
VHVCTAAVKAMHGTFWVSCVEGAPLEGAVSFPWRRREGMLFDPILWAPKRWCCANVAVG